MENNNFNVVFKMLENAINLHNANSEIRIGSIMKTNEEVKSITDCINMYACDDYSTTITKS